MLFLVWDPQSIILLEERKKKYKKGLQVLRDKMQLWSWQNDDSLTAEVGNTEAK